MAFWDRFRRKQAETNVIEGGISALIPLSAADRKNFRYREFALEGYKKNATLASCIRLIARSIAGLPFEVFRERDDEKVPLDNHPVWDLLRRPNPGTSWRQFNDALWAHYFLGGNIFILAAGPEQAPAELWLLRPDRVTIKMSKDGKQLLGYEYEVEGRTTLYPKEQVLHIRAFDPLNDLYGDAPPRAAVTSIDQDNNAGIWNDALLKNLGRPGMFLKAPQGMPPLSRPQRNVLKEEFTSQHAGALKAGTPMVLGGGYDVQEVGFNPKEMDWKDGRIMAQVLIALSTGTPPELVGIQGQKTYSNYQEARKSFYEETVIPLGEMLMGDLTVFLGRRWTAARNGGEFMIGIDKDNVPALQESQDAIHKRATEEVKEGIITINEARAELGREPIDGGDEILVPSNKLPLTFVTGEGPPNDETMPRTEIEEDEEITELEVVEG